MIQTRGTILSADNPIFLEDNTIKVFTTNYKTTPKKKEFKDFCKNENNYPKTLQMNVNHLGTEDEPSLKNNSVMTEK